MIDRTVGRYRVLARLGEGGMGTVWKAEDALLGRPIALKLLAADLAADPDARRRFLREARAMSALNHHGICTVHDAGEADGHVYIALAWIDGQTLSALAERAPLAIAEAARVGVATAEALGHAHARGVVHRDVTGRNIMLARDGRVLVLDFGLAIAVGLSRLTSSGTRLGTPAYMSPEVVRGERADARSDLYGLGVVLYEALTGTLPFESDRHEAVLFKILNEVPEPPSRRRRDVPPWLEQVVLHLMEKDPARRPADADAVVASLRAELNALPPARTSAPAWQTEPPLPGRPSRRRYVAVMPFDTATADETDDAPFARGLAEILGTALARDPDLHVIPPAMAAQEDAGGDLRQVARQLGANLIVRGSVRRRETQVRITWSLLDPARGIQIGGDTLEGVAGDPFRLEDRLVSSVFDALGCDPPDSARTLANDPAARERFLQAVGYLQRHEHEASVDGAIGLLERLRSTEEPSAEIEAALARAYLRKYQLTLETRWESQGAAACAHAIALDPGDPDVLATRGELALLTGRHEVAIGSFEQALALVPDRPDALLGLGRAYHAARKLEDAERVFRRAIEVRPDYWGAHNALGRFLQRVGRHAEALECFERVVELTPDNAYGWLNLVRPLFELERFDEALDACRRSIEISPRGQSLSTLGSLLFYLGRYEEAAAAFERAVAIQPTDPMMWGNLGSAVALVPGRGHRAREALERATALARERLDLNPADAYLWAQRAGWMSNLGRHGEAVHDVQRSLGLEPANPEYMVKACAVYHQSGSRDDSLRWLQRALQHGCGTSQILRDPYLTDLRADPEFTRIVEEETHRHGGHHTS